MTLAYSLQTGVDGFLRPTNFALDFTAPVESASASFDHFLHFRFVASTATHQIASVDADRRLVTDASLRPGDAQFQILFAEIRRILVVNQIFLARRFVFGVVGFQLVVVLFPSVTGRPSGVADQDAGSSVETIFQIIAHYPEERQSHPASPDRTRAAHSVTFAFLSHFSRDVLKKIDKKRETLILTDDNSILVQKKNTNNKM